ncbi:MAG: hypothetical protein K2J31_06390 [Alistipes sp.]|nr:hypothetical protein [Alistipes sp.]
MKNTENQGNRCNDCEQMFEDNIHGMVDEVDGYTHKDHRQKEKEVRDAYDTGRSNPTQTPYGGNTTDKTTYTGGNTAAKSFDKTADKVTSKVENGVKSAATSAKQFVEKGADKIGGGVKSAAATATRFADKTADKVNSKIDKFEAGRNDYDKKR